MNLYGNTSELSIKTEVKRDKTVIDDLFFTTPFKVLPPFYENGVMNITILSVSAGLMDGDRQKINLDIGSDSHVLVTSQTFEKVHKMKRGEAKRENQIQIHPGAKLIYQPLPTIPFAGSRFENKTYVNLVDDSCIFVYSEILTCGRAHHGERFKFDMFKNFTEIRRKGKLIYRDNIVFDPKVMPLEEIGFFEGYTHLGTLIFCGLDDPNKWAEIFRGIAKESGFETGVTVTFHNLVVVKILHNNSDGILNVFDKMISSSGLV